MLSSYLLQGALMKSAVNHPPLACTVSTPKSALKKWESFTIRAKVFTVVATLFVMSTILIIGKQSISVYNANINKLIKETLPERLEGLSYQISSEIIPLIENSNNLAHDPFVEQWIKDGAPDSLFPLIEKRLKIAQEMQSITLSSFYTLETPIGTEYMQYSRDGLYRVPLEDYGYNIFYPNFLATGKPYELSLQDMGDDSFILYINYKSSAVNPSSNKPYNVAGLGIKADQIIDIVKKLKFGESGSAMLATSNGEIGVKTISDALAKEIEGSTILFSDTEEIVIEEIIADCDHYYIGSIWIATLDRFLVVNVPKAQITFPIYKQILSSILFAILALVVSLLILNITIQSLTKPILALEKVMSKISVDKNLTLQVVESGSAEIAHMGKGFNILLDSIKTLISKSIESSNKNQLISNQLSNTSSQVEKNIEETNEIIRTVVLNANDVNKNIQDTVEEAKQSKDDCLKANNMLIETKQEIVSFSSKVEYSANEEIKLACSIKELAEKMSDIRTVLSTINQIADQTNLLAINAAVEAARAGQYGSGFAVVANEVKTLATQTQNSLIGINTTIEEVVTTTGAISEEMNASSLEISKLVKSSKNIEELIVQTAKIVDNTSTVTEKTVLDFETTGIALDKIINDMNSIQEYSSENTRSSEEIADAAQHLNSLTETLTNELRVFKTE